MDKDNKGGDVGGGGDVIPGRRTLKKWKEEANFFFRKGEITSKKLKSNSFLHYKNKDGGPLSRHKPFDPNDPDDPLKPIRIYCRFYSKHRYPDVIPAINQAVYCPYDPSHLYHMGQYGPKHLVKCKWNNPITSSYFEVCDFNRSHVVPKGKMKQHFTNCRAYQLWAYEQAKFGLPMTLEKAVNPPPAEIPKEEEQPCFTWDDGEEATDYNKPPKIDEDEDEEIIPKVINPNSFSSRYKPYIQFKK